MKEVNSMRFKGLSLGVGFVLLSAVALIAQYAPYYVLDGYGGVHAGGGAPAITPATPYFGWNIARDLVHIAVATSNSGDGILVLDGFGGVHKGGKLSTVTIDATPYFGWDIAKAIDFRRIDPQAYGDALASHVDITSSTFVKVIDASVNMVLPDAGYVIVTISCMAENPSAGYFPTGDYVLGYIGIGVDSPTSADNQSWCYLGDTLLAGAYYPSESLSATKIYHFSSSGLKQFYFLALRSGGTGIFRIEHPTITCLYVNKGPDSFSSAAPLPSDLALAPNPGQPDKSAVGPR